MTQKMEGKQLRRLSPSEEWECRGGWQWRRWGGEGDRRPLGASSRGPTSWLINPIKSPESIGAPGEGGRGVASSLFLSPGQCATTGSVMIHVPPPTNITTTTFCIWIILSSPSCRLARRSGRAGTGRDNRTGRGQGRRVERRSA